MDDFKTTKKEQERFEAFVSALTQLTKTHGVALQATGGVYIAHNPEDLKNINYSCDASSGDLNYTF